MTHSSHNHLRAQEYKITKIPQSPLKIFKNQPIKTRQNPNYKNLDFLTNQNRVFQWLTFNDRFWSLQETYPVVVTFKSPKITTKSYWCSENYDFFLNPIFLVNLYSTFPDQPSELISRLNLWKISTAVRFFHRGKWFYRINGSPRKAGTTPRHKKIGILIGHLIGHLILTPDNP